MKEGGDMANMHYDELWSLLSEKSRLFESQMDMLERKRTGSYYTDLKLTDVIMHELVERLIDTNANKRICEYRFLEPCVGSGNFVFSYLKAVKNTSIDLDEVQIMLDNIYVADVNLDALKCYKESLRKVVKLFWNIELSNEYFNTHLSTGVLINIASSEMNYISIQEAFNKDIVENGFDIVVTNPPYKNLKAEKGQYINVIDYDSDKDKYLAISKIVRKQFKYSTSGVLNLYKLFVEEIIDNYANENAFISLLIPSSIMSDKTCMKLRTHMLTDNKLISVKLISEGSGYIDAQQALCALFLQKGKKTDSVTVIKDYYNFPKESAQVEIEDILNVNTGNAIVAVSSKEYRVLRKLRRFPVVKDLSFVTNLRGELDLTTNKYNIVNNATTYPLIRGRDVGFYKLREISESEFITDDFINITKKKRYIEQERIACQQIANMNKDRRVTFAIVPKKHVLGNSCNFIAVEDNIYGIDIYTLLGLFNSNIINWLFKLTSSNNHVNNYEIDCFPIPVESPELKKISKLVKMFLLEQDYTILEMIEQLVYKAYGISPFVENKELVKSNYIEDYMKAIKYIVPEISKEKARAILSEQIKIDIFIEDFSKFEKKVAIGITTKYISLFQGRILNHTTFKLSDLDLEMIKSVPTGGNWKDIPLETVKKSKRLMRITQTGGRTTLYGRIDYTKPSYTITTYFNRPGNGTYVHPVHERVLTVREAARFQGFKDDYYFFGNKTQILRQVGNAVPTLLAYQIAREIKKKTGCSKSVDLFCGAGGMTAGFKAAGIESVLSTDIEESACITLKINNPDIKVLCGDITKSEIKDAIERAALDDEVDIISGGPPCQGFSMAGFRAEDDPRNQLFQDFVDIVKRISPKIIVFENVEGLLSYQGGKTYREVHKLFSDLGYNTEGKILKASDYAVPQKRKRVIIICTRKDLNISPGSLFPKSITIKEENQVTAKETISDLEFVPCNDSAIYADVEESDILEFFKGKITYEEYIDLRTPSDTQLIEIAEQRYEQLSFTNWI